MPAKKRNVRGLKQHVFGAPERRVLSTHSEDSVQMNEFKGRFATANIFAFFSYGKEPRSGYLVLKSGWRPFAPRYAVRNKSPERPPPPAFRAQLFHKHPTPQPIGNASSHAAFIDRPSEAMFIHEAHHDPHTHRFAFIRFFAADRGLQHGRGRWQGCPECRSSCGKRRRLSLSLSPERWRIVSRPARGGDR